MKKRIILAVTICLIFSLSPYIQAAAYKGSGTASDPYQIWTPEEMNAIGLNPDDWASCFKLMTDIDMSNYTGTQYNIIGNFYMDMPFTGTFDGNGHAIRNLTYTTTAPADYTGLFGYIYQGTIENLGIENISISCTNGFYIGGLAGDNSGTINGCYATGTVNGGYEVGGLAGSNSGVMNGCFAAVSVYGKSDVGGLVGYNLQGMLNACHATGSVSGTGQYSHYVGGLVGQNNSNGTITGCYATGSVSGYSYLGGLAGGNICGEIISCYATGSVSGIDSVGGLVGKNFSSESGCFSSCYGCYSTGLVSGTKFVGGLIGYKSDSILTVCFWDTQTSRTINGIGDLNSNPSGVTGKPTIEMKTQSTFIDAGWDFVDETDNGTEDIWTMNGYPIFSWQTTIEITGTLNISLSANNQGQIVFVLFNPIHEMLSWTLSGFELCPWISSISPVSGSSSGPSDRTTITVVLDTAGLMPGEYTCPLTVSIDNDHTRDIQLTLLINDERVDFEDFTRLVSYWGKTDCAAGQPCAQVDWFVDQKIDIFDLMQLAQSWLDDEIQIGYPKKSVDFENFSLLASYWQKTDCAAGQPCAQADWFVDQKIDIFDLMQLAQSWLDDEIQISFQSQAIGMETDNFLNSIWK